MFACVSLHLVLQTAFYIRRHPGDCFSLFHLHRAESTLLPHFLMRRFRFCRPPLFAGFYYCFDLLSPLIFDCICINQDLGCQVLYEVLMASRVSPF